MNDWWSGFYDDVFASVYFAPGQRVETDADAIVRLLSLEPGMRVFDQCCGTGRISHALARRGLVTFGVDQSARYVEKAKEKAVGQDCTFVAGDAREVIAPHPCDAALSWATSLGHDPEEAGTLAMLRATGASLRPGGWLLVDYYSVPRLVQTLKDEISSRHETPEGTVVVRRRARADWAAGLFHQVWRYELPDGRRHERTGTTRLFMPHELVRLAGLAGFESIELFGDLDGAPFHYQSARCLLRARRSSS